MDLPQVKFTRFINDEKEAVALDKIKFNVDEKKIRLYSSVNNNIKEENILPIITNKELFDVMSFSYRPKIANTSSAMTDKSSVYLYTGSESDFVNGNWYYYNGDDWVNGGVYGEDLKITTPEMFGAVGDGVTDDTQALQNMYESGSNIFLFSKGKTYLTKGNVVLNLSNSTFLGNGATIKWDSHYFTSQSEEGDSQKFPYEQWAIFSTKPEVAYERYWVLKGSLIFRDLNFDGNRDEQENVTEDTQDSAYKGLVLELFGYKNVVIDHCSFYNTHANAIHTRATQNIYVNNCRFEKIGEPNIELQTTTKNCLTTGSSWSATPSKDLVSMENIIFTNNHIINTTDAVVCSYGSQNTVIENNYANGCTTFFEYYPAYSFPIKNTTTTEDTTTEDTPTIIGYNPINCRIVNNVCLNPRNYFVFARQDEYIDKIFNTLTVNNNIVYGIGKNVLEKQYIWATGCGFFNNSNARFDVLEICNNRCTFSRDVYSYSEPSDEDPSEYVTESILPTRMNLNGNIIKFCDNDLTLLTLKQNNATVDVTLSSFINVSDDERTLSRVIFNGNNINISGLKLTPVINANNINYFEFSNNYVRTNFEGLDTVKCIINIYSDVNIVKVDDNVDDTIQVTDFLSFFRVISPKSTMIASVNSNILTNNKYLVQGYSSDNQFAALTVVGNTMPNGLKVFRISNPAVKSIVANNLISTSTT